MPTRTKKAAAAKQVEPEEEYEFGYLVDKDPTPKHEAAAAWISDQTGYDMDVKTVQLLLLMYTRFQKSPENQQAIADAKERAAAAAEERENRPAKPAKKAAAPTRRRAAAEVEDTEEAEETPRRGARRTGATAVSGAKPARGRRRPAPPAEDEDDLG